MPMAESYMKRTLLSFTGRDLTAVEKVLLLSLLAMMFVTGVDSLHGAGVGNEAAIQMAKQVTQQEVMAQGNNVLETQPSFRQKL